MKTIVLDGMEEKPSPIHPDADDPVNPPVPVTVMLARGGVSVGALFSLFVIALLSLVILTPVVAEILEIAVAYFLCPLTSPIPATITIKTNSRRQCFNMFLCLSESIADIAISSVLNTVSEINLSFGGDISKKFEQENSKTAMYFRWFMVVNTSFASG